jgi:AraC family transcriptional activator FtrA
VPKLVTPPENLAVAVIAHDGLATFEFAIAVEVFGLPRPEFVPWYRFAVCAVEPGPLRATGGIRIEVDGGMELLETAGTIVVPGWKNLDEPAPGPLVEALVRAHGRGARLVSICSGAFLLADTGLLAGRRATTHWTHAARLQRRHPEIVVDPSVLYVDEGQVLTSAGSAAGLDLCLHLVRRDFGAAVAAQVARRLVIYPQRDGGQAQFIDHRPAGEGRGGLGRFMDWLGARLAEELTINAMAREAGMSRRTFLRRFRDHTGMAPHAWIVRERLRRVRILLETTDRSVEAVAFECGFGTAATLRHHFRQAIGTSPQDYRRRFRMAS